MTKIIFPEGCIVEVGDVGARNSRVVAPTAYKTDGRELYDQGILTGITARRRVSEGTLTMVVKHGDLDACWIDILIDGMVYKIDRRYVRIVKSNEDRHFGKSNGG